MSNYSKYIETLRNARNGLLDLSRTLKYGVKKYHIKPLEHLFIREAVKILKDSLKEKSKLADEYLGNRDKVSKMIFDAENKHDKREQNKQKAVCSVCKCKLYEKWNVLVDEHGKVFCSEHCVQKFYGIRTLNGGSEELHKFVSDWLKNHKEEGEQ